MMDDKLKAVVLRLMISSGIIGFFIGYLVGKGGNL